MIIQVDKTTVDVAAHIHSESWIESHRAFCSEDFVMRHSPEHQCEYLLNEMSDGASLYMLVTDKPVGIVSVKDDLIENLYILPEEQSHGHGTELLLFAIGKCVGTPRLWILDNNRRAYSLYYAHGFRLTGNSHRLSDTVTEIEMAQTAEQ